MGASVLRSLLAGVLAGALLGAGAASAEIVVTEKVNHYAVSGVSGRDLGRSMLRGGARTINLRHAIAATTTRFDFTDPVLAVERGRCVVKAITVRLSIEYQLPKWTGRHKANARLRRSWDAFYAELVRHEQTHGRIAREFARRIERELLRLSGTQAFGCSDFGAFSEARFAALSAELRRQQLAFDRRENQSNSTISRLQLALLETQ